MRGNEALVTFLGSGRVQIKNGVRVTKGQKGNPMALLTDRDATAGELEAYHVGRTHFVGCDRLSIHCNRISAGMGIVSCGSYAWGRQCA